MLCSSLKILLMGYNQLTALPESLFQLEGLVNLDIQHNKLTAVGNSWSQLTNLKVSLGLRHLHSIPLSNHKPRKVHKKSLSPNPDAHHVPLETSCR